MSDLIPELFNDRDVARLFGMSPGWVRVQRHYRRHGVDHALTIDPVLVGTRPRYRREDVMALIDSIKGQN
jgi:hypothetical protein